MADSKTQTDAPDAYFPGWIARLIIAVTLSFVVLIRVLGRTADPPFPLNDPAVCNLLTLVFSFVAALTAWIWFCFRSGYSLSARRTVFVGTFVAIGGMLAVFRYREVSGSMVPTFTPRWTTPAPDQELGKLETNPTATPIDLLTTTPDDFPQFLGPERSGWIAEPQLARDWSASPPKLIWKRPIGAGWSAFAAVNGYAVTMEQRGADEWVTCYEIATGNPVWGHSIKGRHENPMGGVGPRSTPTIHQGRVYALGATGVLRCLDGASGKLLWSDDLRRRFGVSNIVNWTILDEVLVQWGRAASPLPVDNLVIVPGGGPTGQAKNLVAFDAVNGSLVWEAENKKDDGTADQISYASPSLAVLAGRRQILIVNETTASGHDPATGERLWSVHTWPGSSSSMACASQAVAVDSNRVLLSKGYSGGAKLVQISVRPDGTFAAEVQWQSPRVLQTKFTNVVIHGSHAYGLSEGILECVELATGKRAWKNGRYEHGQILGVGDLLLVLSEEGELHLVELNPARFSQLGSFPALEGKTWNNLCLYGKRLLVRNAQEAACFELP
jgi:outer membrane protein assembly factor BamB